MPANSKAPLTELASAASEVAEGDYESAKKIFEFTKPGTYPSDIQAVAEAFGMMIVKVEAREFRLERAVAEIRKKNAALEHASRARAEFGTMTSFIVIVLCVYTMALSYMQEVAKVDLNLRRSAVEIISFGFLILQILLAVTYISRHKPRASDYGWTTHGWKRSVLVALGYSAIALAGMVALKWWLVGHSSGWAGQPIIDWGYWGGWFTVTSYFFVAPAQELIARGFLQSSIERFLTGKNRTAIAILLTSVQFGVVHLHFSFATGVVAMISGLLFGAIFARQRTLVGVSLSHFVLGTLAFGPLRLLGF